MIGLVLLLGALAVSRHELTLGGLVAYITLALLLVWPIQSMGYLLASGQEAATAAQRVYEILDTEPAITDPAAPRPPRPRRAATCAFERRRVQLPGGPGRSCATSTWCWRPGRPWRWSGPPGRARPRC